MRMTLSALLSVTVYLPPNCTLTATGYGTMQVVPPAPPEAALGQQQVNSGAVSIGPYSFATNVLLQAGATALFYDIDGYSPLSVNEIQSNTFAIAGDSIMSVHTINNATNAVFWSQGVMNWAMMKAGWPLRFLLNAAVGGLRTDEILARVWSTVIPAAPAVCVFNGLWNDIAQGVSSKDIVQNIKTITTLLVENNIVPVYIGPHPSSSYASTASRLAVAEVLNGVRDWMQTAGGIFVDTYSVLLDTATGNALADTTLDGLHLTARGAQIIGSGPLYDALQYLVPRYKTVCTSPDPTNMHTNPLYLGSNASGTNGFTTTLTTSAGKQLGPDGCTADQSSAASSTMTDPATRTDGRAGRSLLLQVIASATNGFARLSTGPAWFTTWSSGSYTRASWRIPSIPNGFTYNAAVGGTTAATEPSQATGNPWPTVEGGTITDGSVTWKAYRIPQPGETWAAELEYIGGVVNSGAALPNAFVVQQDSGLVTQFSAQANYFDGTVPAERYPTTFPASGILRTPNFVVQPTTRRFSIEFRVPGANAADAAAGLCNARVYRVPNV